MNHGTWPANDEYVDGYAVKKSRKHANAIDIWGEDGSYSLLLPGWPLMRRYPDSVHRSIESLRSTASSGTRTIVVQPQTIVRKKA